MNQRLVVRVLIQFGELDVVVQHEDSTVHFSVVNVDFLKLRLATEEMLPNRNGHRELVAANREG